MLKLNLIISRRYKLFLKYCIIGILSIFVELLVRKILLNINFNKYIILFVPLLIGIFFAFIFNIKFNFNIPRYYYKYSFIYFTLISFSSFSLQIFLSKLISFENLSYESIRFIMSGLIFLIAYNFHIKYSFKKNKKVGVAIYLDNKENIDDVFSKVGFYPDYIHIDMVDKTMNENVSEPDFLKFNQIKKKWPNHRIESHIMSKKPNKYLKKIIPHSDVIYFHHEIEEDLNIIKEEILKNKKRAGIVLHASKKYENLKNIIKDFEEVLILCIDKPGESGQEFLNSSLTIIDKINKFENRSNFTICVDGGLSQKKIIQIDCDKIVSASNVFKSLNPKKQIMNLKKLLNN